MDIQRYQFRIQFWEIKYILKDTSGLVKKHYLNSILGSLQPNGNDGVVDYFGIRIYKYRNYTRPISALLINILKFNDTIYNNIKYSNNASVQDVKKILKSLNTNIFDKLPNGIHTQVGVDSSFMSGGQRQLIILLRTYFRKAKIVLMDEPIAAVDENNVSLILKMINMISKDRTLLVISHNTRYVTNYQ